MNEPSPYPYDEDGWKKLCEVIKTYADAEQEAGSRMFMGKPDAWFEKHRWRCCNDHVCGAYLITDFGVRCLTCYEPVALTFPADVSGPLAAHEPPPDPEEEEDLDRELLAEALQESDDG